MLHVFNRNKLFKRPLVVIVVSSAVGNSHQIHTCFPIIASNEFRYKEIMLTTDSVTKNSCLERIRLQRVHTYNEFGYKRVVLTTNSVIKSSLL